MNKVLFDRVLEDVLKKETLTDVGVYCAKAKKDIKRLKRAVKKNQLPVQENHYGKEGVKWLVQNFSQLYGKTAVCCASLKDARRKKLQNLNFIYEISQAVSKMCVENGELLEVGEFADLVNKNKHFTVSLEECACIVISARLCFCQRAADIFSELLNNGECTEQTIKSLQNIFESLERLYRFDIEDAFLSNPVENVLMRDVDGIYQKQTLPTKTAYRKSLSEYSRKRKMSQLSAAEQIIKACREKGCHIGKVLCPKAKGGRLYLLCLFSVTAVIWMLLLTKSLVFLPAVIIVYRCTKLFLDRIVCMFDNGFVLPSIELDKIPDGKGVLVTVTCLLTGGKSDGEIFDRLEKMYFSNGGENVYFSVLADLGDASRANLKSDEKILEHASTRVAELNKKYGDCFYFFVRQREYNRQEGCYMARERKRGAVTALCKYLCGKSDEFGYYSIKMSENICRNIKYVFTLDSDTNLSFGCLEQMAGIMLHPQNTPVFDEKKGRIVSGYGILQPSMATELKRSRQTAFTRIMCSDKGTDVYSFARYGVEMRLFGKAVFCGKGMFDKEAFYKTLCGDREFCRNRVLSHDAPEGARLRCAVTNEVTLTDSFPSQHLTYFKRLHRWVRGDVQNCIFFANKVKNQKGSRSASGVDGVYRLFLAENLVTCLVPVLGCGYVFLSLVTPTVTSALCVLTGIFAFTAPFIFELLFSLLFLRKNNFTSLFYSKGVYTPFWSSFLNMLLSASSGVQNGCVCADAVIRSLYRLFVSKRKLLEWTTAAQDDKEKKDGLLGYVKKNLLSGVAGCLVFVLSGNGFVKILGLMWLFFPFVAYVTSVPKEETEYELSHEQRQTVKRYVKDMWRFFEDGANSTTHPLPCDSISFYPRKKHSSFTSPTNIGLYLLSCVCMLDFFDGDEEDILQRLEAAAECIEKLEKYDGLLYNWYDVNTLKKAQPYFLSSVDLGNYKACLLCCAALLTKDKAQREKELGQRLLKLAEFTDVSVLYNKKRNLFTIGATVEKSKLVYDENCYDMLMSEARILSYTETAFRNVPKKHYSSLARTVVTSKYCSGYGSWNGTAFEYFMPCLFLAHPKGSACYEAIGFCFDRMRANSVKVRGNEIFGISESAYCDFDRQSNYKYKAFGVPEISVRDIELQKVISPYSVFLMSCFAPKTVLKCLENMEKAGLYGQYGFYESLDLENYEKGKETGVVRSFMCHHVGMSICACANLLFDDCLVKSYMGYPQTDSASELAEERIPFAKTVKRKKIVEYTPAENQRSVPQREKPKKVKNAVLKSDGLELCANIKRGITIKYDGCFVNKPALFDETGGLFKVYVSVGTQAFCISDVMPETDGAKITFRRDIVTNTMNRYTCSVSFTLCKNTSYSVRARVTVRRLLGTELEKINCMFAFEPFLDTSTELKKTLPFANPYVECKKDESENAVCFVNGKNMLCLCVAYEKGEKTCFVGNKEYVRSLVQSKKISELCDKSTFDVKDDDCYCCIGSPLENNDGVFSAELVLSVSENEKCALMGVVRAGETKFEECCEALREYNGQTKNNRSKPKKAVRGARLDKAEIMVKNTVTLADDCFKLLSDECTLIVTEKSLGFTFGKSLSDKLTACFDDVFEYGACEQILIGDGEIDTCRNSDKSCFFPYKAEYYGTADNQNRYTVKTFPMPGKCVRITVVEGVCGQKVKYSIKPFLQNKSKLQIAGGVVYFDINGKTAFLYGCHGNCQARLYAENPVQAEFDGDFAGGAFVFAAGFAQSLDEVFEITSEIKECYSELEKKSQQYALERTPVFDMADKDGKALVKSLGIEDCGGRILAYDRNEYVNALDTLLLMYTGSTQKENALVKSLCHMENADFKTSLVMCLSLAKYMQESSEASLKDGEMLDLYRKGLIKLFAAERKVKDSPHKLLPQESLLLKVCLCEMGKAAEKINDTRTAMRLYDGQKRVEQACRC